MNDPGQQSQASKASQVPAPRLEVGRSLFASLNRERDPGAEKCTANANTWGVY